MIYSKEGHWPQSSYGNYLATHRKKLMEWLLTYLKLSKADVGTMVVSGLILSSFFLWRDHVSQSDLIQIQDKFSTKIAEIHGEIASVQASVANLQYTLTFDHADSRLRQTQDQIFALSQHIKQNGKLGKPDDTDEAKRLYDLKSLETLYLDQLRELQKGHIPPLQ